MATRTQIKPTRSYARIANLQFRSVDAASPLPAGICGRMQGVALVFGVPDDYDTIFARGCLDRTIVDRVNQGKVKLFADHGPFTHTHVGVIRSVTIVGDSAIMVADLFDTDAGREMKEYLAAIIASNPETGAETGLSVGFRVHDSQMTRDTVSGEMHEVFTEIELREISITPANAVPGTEVTGVRGGDLLKRALTNILRSLDQRDAEAVFETVYASAAESDTSGDRGAAPSALTRQTNAETVAESAKDDAAAGAEFATDDERVLIARRFAAL